jgi:hypothetical protein
MTLIEYKSHPSGPSFFIPVNEAQKIIEDDIEVENGNDEAERFDNWMRNGEESLLREMEADFPYK